MRNQQQVREKEKQDRARGLVPKWGLPMDSLKAAIKQIDNEEVDDQKNASPVTAGEYTGKHLDAVKRFAFELNFSSKLANIDLEKDEIHNFVCEEEPSSLINDTRQFFESDLKFHQEILKTERIIIDDDQSDEKEEADQEECDAAQ